MAGIRPEMPFWDQYKLFNTQNGTTQKYDALIEFYAFDGLNNQYFLQDINFFKTKIAEFKTTTPQAETSTSFAKKTIYRLLCIAGALFALCSGFDGMISVMSMLFPQLYLGFIIAFGIISALTGFGVFIARDKPSMAQEIGIDEPTDFSGIEAYLFLYQEYLHLKKEDAKQNALKARSTNGQGVIEYFNDLQLEEFEELDHLFLKAIELNQDRLQSWTVFAESQLVLMIAAILFFSDGFFIGEAIGDFLAGVLNLDPVFFTLSMAILIGICALAAYCFVERPSLKEYLHGTFFTNQANFKKKKEEIESDMRDIGLIMLCQSSASSMRP